METFNLYEKYGPIITDDESKDALSIISQKLDEGRSIIIDFSNVLAMTTKGAKNIFGDLYVSLGKEKFNNNLSIINTSNTIKEIIYDSILNRLSSSKDKNNH